MASQVLFGGLVVDENENPVDSKIVGGEGFYVVDDDGFMRHIESEIVDRQVLEHMRQMIEDHEDLVSEGTMRMIGQEDIFTKAAIDASLKNIGDQFDALLEQGMPEEVRAWMGMSGFRIVINRQGDVLRIDQPGVIEGPDE
ncbi:MAG: hypothetical protein PVI78_06855 [Anaerolineales bacterium]